MTPPLSAARALHDLMAKVAGRAVKQEQSVYHAWQAVSGLKIASADFARFHTEAMTLLQTVTESVQSLPPHQQERYLSYLPQWWDAMARSRFDWAEKGRAFIEPAALDMLGGLSDLLEARAELRAPRGPQTRETLTRAVNYLLNDVEGKADLPASVRAQIVADLKHISWLLENVEWFGVDHAVDALEQATGRVIVEATKSPSSRPLKSIGIQLVAALAVISAGTASVAQIADNVRSTFGIEAADETGGDSVEEAVKRVYIVQDSRTLTAVPAPSGSEPVDAEIVEEDGS